MIGAVECPVFTLVPQPRLRESAWGSMAMNDVPVEVSASYCFFRNPADLTDPSNYADDIESTLDHIEKALADDQPDWFLNRLGDARYPMLWETVRTTRLGVEPDLPLAERLAEHVNHVLINTVDHRRSWSGDGPPILDHEVTARHAQSGFSLSIDGVDCEALIIDTDPDLVGWAVEVDAVAVTVAIDRDRASEIKVALERRKVTPAEPDDVEENSHR